MIPPHAFRLARRFARSRRCDDPLLDCDRFPCRGVAQQARPPPAWAKSTAQGVPTELGRQGSEEHRFWKTPLYENEKGQAAIRTSRAQSSSAIGVFVTLSFWPVGTPRTRISPNISRHVLLGHRLRQGSSPGREGRSVASRLLRRLPRRLHGPDAGLRRQVRRRRLRLVGHRGPGARRQDPLAEGNRPQRLRRLRSGARARSSTRTPPSSCLRPVEGNERTSSLLGYDLATGDVQAGPARFRLDPLHPCPRKKVDGKTCNSQVADANGPQGSDGHKKLWWFSRDGVGDTTSPLTPTVSSTVGGRGGPRRRRTDRDRRASREQGGSSSPTCRPSSPVAVGKLMFRAASAFSGSRRRQAALPRPSRKARRGRQPDCDGGWLHHFAGGGKATRTRRRLDIVSVNDLHDPSKAASRRSPDRGSISRGAGTFTASARKK